MDCTLTRILRKDWARFTLSPVFGSAVVTALAEDPLWQAAGAAACVSACLYSVLYKASAALSPRLWKQYAQLSDSDQVDWNTRVPSTLHAVVVSTLCLFAFWLTDEFTDSPDSLGRPPPVLRASQLSSALLGCSLGYFGADAAMLYRVPGIATPEMVLHHAVGLLSLLVALQVRAAHLYVLLMLSMEATTPFVNARWYMDRASMRSSRAYLINGLLLLAAWALARIALLAPFAAHLVRSWSDVVQLPSHAIAILLGVPLILFGLNAVWFAKIVKGAYKLVRPARGAAAVGAARGARTKGGTPAVAVHGTAEALSCSAQQLQQRQCSKEQQQPAPWPEDPPASERRSRRAALAGKLQQLLSSRRIVIQVSADASSHAAIDH